MAQSYRSRFLATQRNNEAAMKALFAALAREIAAEVTRRADADGNVPRSATFEIQQAAGDLVRRLFLGRNRLGEWAPFDTVGNGALIPLSPYMRQLWAAIKSVVRIPVEQNAAVLRNRLPVDVQAAMQQATKNPFVAAKAMVAEQVFRPNQLATYEAPHTWVDPNGYRLSDRVWNVATDERRQLDQYLDRAIREGRGALTMSRELEAFLIPGRQLTTNKPYGTTASYGAMRLARTEITRAHGQAAQVSAAMNPFVSGMKWNLSGRHPRIDICDQYARGGPNGDGVYPLGEVPGYPPHPMCLCVLTNAMVENPDAMIEQLRADVQAAKQEFINLAGPLEVERFTQLLLGQGLETEYQGVTSRTIAPPVVIRPPIVTPPTTIQPAIVPPPPPPVDLAAEARQKVIELDRQYARQIEQIEDEVTGVAGELAEATRLIDRLSESLRKREGTEAAAQIRAKLEEKRSAASAIFNRRRALETEIGRIQGERGVRLRALVQVDRPAQVRLSAPGADPSLLSEWQRGANEFNNLVSADVAPAQAVPFTETQRNRSGYDPNAKVIEMRAGAGERVVVHELAHWLEDHNPELHRRVVEFYERRTQGDTLQWMGPGYGPEELYRRDKWITEYMGLDYHDGRERYATEVLSMGLDHFYNKTALLAQRDPEMFDFVFNIVRGQ